jgi:LytS/YehU family sensor histidine kinase
LASIQTFALSDADNKNLVANISKFSHIMRETLESTYKEYVTIEQELILVEYLDLQKVDFLIGLTTIYMQISCLKLMNCKYHQ